MTCVVYRGMDIVVLEDGYSGVGGCLSLVITSDLVEVTMTKDHRG
jgi:hypothetical protein